MKITDVKTVLLTGPCTNDPFLSKARVRRSAALSEEWIAGSGLSPNFASRVWDIFCQNVERYLEGDALLNELTPEHLNGG